jgi:hypothetical protein
MHSFQLVRAVLKIGVYLIRSSYYHDLLTLGHER